MKSKKVITNIDVIVLVVLLIYLLFIAEDITAVWGTKCIDSSLLF